MIRSSAPRALAFGIVLGATAFLAACGDSTAPEKTLSVAIAVDQAAAPRLETNPSGQQTITCDLDLSARATGAGKAVWEDAVARFYFGTDRSAPTDSIRISRDGARQLWGGEPITPGAPQTTALELSATAPFLMTLDFRYRANDANVKTASVSFDCR